MKRFSCFFIWIFVLTSILPAQEREVKLKVVQTSDIHGNYYPYDFIRRRAGISWRTWNVKSHGNIPRW